MGSRLVVICAVLVLVVLCIAPVSGEDLGSRFGAGIIAAPNAGPVWGGEFTYRLDEHLWLDLGAKRVEKKTDLFVGLSTDLQGLVDVITNIFGVSQITLPKGSRGLGAYDLRADDLFFALAYGVEIDF
jgi:hypothetical protein